MKKIYYTIGEVGKIVKEESHVLRYWESEFDFLRPRKNQSGQRVYSADDLRAVIAISRLVRGKKMTMKEAKVAIRDIDIFAVTIPGEKNDGIENSIEQFGLNGHKDEFITLLKEIKFFLQS